MPLNKDDALRVIRAALAEDTPAGDITSDAVIPADVHFAGTLTARHPMVIAGLDAAAMSFSEVDPTIHFTSAVADGDTIETGTVIATVSGPARALLRGERVALNLLQMLSGIATLTRTYADAIAGTDCTLLDTRKTVPGLRLLSKYASTCGGAKNHRMTLSDAILIKDNHIAVCGGVTAAIEKATAANKGPVEIECDTLEQVAEATKAGAARLLLDNMGPETLEQAVTLIDGRAETEASGGVTLDTIRAIAQSGVDFVSVGRITQSAPAVDIGLDWEPKAEKKRLWKL